MSCLPYFFMVASAWGGGGGGGGIRSFYWDNNVADGHKGSDSETFFEH